MGLKEKKFLIAAAQLLREGIYPSKSKLVKLVGASYSSVWFNKIYANWQNVTQNFTELEDLNNAVGKFRTLDIEFQNQQLQNRILDLEQENYQLKQEQHTIYIELNSAKERLAGIDEERSNILGQLQSRYETQISMLLQEINATHQKYNTELKEYGFASDEAKMEVKLLKSQHKDEINKLNKTIKNLEERLLQYAIAKNSQVEHRHE